MSGIQTSVRDVIVNESRVLQGLLFVVLASRKMECFGQSSEPVILKCCVWTTTARLPKILALRGVEAIADVHFDSVPAGCVRVVELTSNEWEGSSGAAY